MELASVEADVAKPALPAFFGELTPVQALLDYDGMGEQTALGRAYSCPPTAAVIRDLANSSSVAVSSSIGNPLRCSDTLCHIVWYVFAQEWAQLTAGIVCPGGGGTCYLGAWWISRSISITYRTPEGMLESDYHYCAEPHKVHWMLRLNSTQFDADTFEKMFTYGVEA